MAQLENFRLKVFRAVAEHLNFRKAAEQLFLSQPAVTQQIQALEEDLGIRLFDRTGGRVSLTRQGEVLLSHAQKMSRIASDAERDLAAAENRVSGPLLLGVSTTIAQYVLPQLLGAFLAEHPQVHLSLHSGNTDEIVELLLREKIAVGLIEGPTRRREVRAEPFMEDELVLIANPSFGSDRISPAQLKGCTLLLREHGSGSRRVVEAALHKAAVQIKSFRNSIDLDSTEAIKSAVEAGLGLGFASRRAISKELELRTLKVVDVPGLSIKRHFSLVSVAGPGPQGPAAAFREFTLQRARILSTSRRPQPASARPNR